MTSTQSTGWRELSRVAKSECPKLFYNFSRDRDSLNIKVTDLVAIWESSLGRAGIVHDARDQRSSIDPSESTTQLHVLLDKLEQSLEVGNNFLSRAEDTADQTVCLTTRLDLPKPLKPLSWTFKLNPQDAGELAEQLLRPCLHEASVAQQKIESLLRIIKDKDHVLSRLLEKIESTATDLSLIFPGITGLRSRKGRITIQQAQKYVPGMADFDYDRWFSIFDNDNPYASFGQMSMNKLVTGCEQCPKHSVKQHSDWYRALPARGSKHEFHHPNLERPLKRKAVEPPKQDHSTDTDSDFERQPTPPHLKKGNTTRKETRTQTQNSASESEAEAVRRSKKARISKIGKLGGRKATVQALQKSSDSSECEKPQSETVERRASSDQQSEEVEKLQSETETATESDDLSGPVIANASMKGPDVAKDSVAGSGTRGKLGVPKSRMSNESPNQAGSISPGGPLSRSSSRQSSASAQLGSKTKGPRKKSPSQQLQIKHDPDSETDTASDAEPRSPDSTRIESAKTDLKRTSDTSSSESSTKPSVKQFKSPPGKRRLGLLSNSSHSPSKSPSITPRNTPSKLKKHADSPGQPPIKSEIDADTETASESDTPPSPSKQKSKSQVKTEGGPTSTPPPEPKPEPEPVKLETAEEKANRRRNELKHRLNAGTGIGVGGTRKKRKF